MNTNWTEIRREENDYARRTRAEQRAMTTPEQRRETKRENRRDLRRRWAERQERILRQERGW
jgi:hypothetical protein